MVENTCPILCVADLARSLDYYVTKLGFQVDWQGEGFAGISRDSGGIMLIEGSQGNPGTYVWMGVQDAPALLEEYRAGGAMIRHELKNYPWALEFKVNDPDGHVLRIGSGPLEDQPWDEWLD